MKMNFHYPISFHDKCKESNQTTSKFNLINCQKFRTLFFLLSYVAYQLSLFSSTNVIEIQVN